MQSFLVAASDVTQWQRGVYCLWTETVRETLHKLGKSCFQNDLLLFCFASVDFA